MTKFTFYWKTGHREVYSGTNVADAFRRAGYGGGALGAVDFYKDGECSDYVWNKVDRSWKLSIEAPAN